MRPTKEYHLFDGLVTVKGFGVTRSRHNWSLANLKAGDGEIEKLRRTARTIAYHTKNMAVLAPYPTEFNGSICVSDDNRFTQVSNLFWDTIFLRGPKADGILLPQKDMAFAMSSADCATLVLNFRDEVGDQVVIACHAGRNSVLDMMFFKTGNRSRRFDGVVFEAMNLVPEKEKQNVRAWIGLAIGAGEWFEHPKDSKDHPHNRKMINYVLGMYGDVCFAEDGLSYSRGRLDLPALIREQLVRAGVPYENIQRDSVCTYSDKDEKGKHSWYSQVRTPKERNLVLVIRNK